MVRKAIHNNTLKGKSFYLAVGVFCLLATVSAVQAGDPFSLVILPDTQFYTDSTTNRVALFAAQTAWVAANRTNLNIRFVLHEGDATEHGYAYRGTNTLEWQRASDCMASLDGVVPYLMVYGNHDLYYNAGTYTRNTDLFNAYFPLSRFQAAATVVDHYPAGRSDNLAAVFPAGGVEWLVLALEWGATDAALSWADQVIRRYPRHRVIILTHCYLYLDGNWHGLKASHNSDPHETYPPVNNGLEIWDKLVRRHPNIALVFNGHAATNPNETGARRTDAGDHGNAVCQMVANYQIRPNGGEGYLRLLQFDPAAGTLSVSTYSPPLNRYLTDAGNRFVITNAALFDATPPTTPAAVRAEAVDCRTCRLTWDAAEDAETGIAGYALFRDTQEVAFVQGTEYTDASAPPDTICSYRVAAVSGAGLWSEGSASTVAVTPRDDRAPAATNVWASASNEVRVAFTGEVDSRGAVDPTNYTFGDALDLQDVALAPDRRQVVLTTGPMEAGSCYPLRIQGWESQHPDGDRTSRDWLFEYAPPVVAEDFGDGDLAGWRVVDEGTVQAPSAWSVQTNVLRQFSYIYGPDQSAIFNRKGSYVLWTAEVAQAWTDLSVEFDVRSDFEGGVGLLFRYQNPSNYYRFEMDQRHKYRRLFRRKNGADEMLAWNWQGYPLASNLHVRIEAMENSFRVFVNGEDVFGRTVVDEEPLASGTVALWTWRARPVWFDNVVVRPIQIGTLTEEYSQYILEYWDAGYDWQGRGGGGNGPRGGSSLNPNADADGDGMTNYKEYVSMTHPMNRDSVFRVSVAATNADRVRLSFPSHTSRYYRVYATRTIEASGTKWWPLQSAAFRGQAGQTVREDALRDSMPPLMPADRRYYRVDVQRPM